jgi:RecB family endonuclease NucS
MQDAVVPEPQLVGHVLQAMTVEVATPVVVVKVLTVMMVKGVATVIVPAQLHAEA